MKRVGKYHNGFRGVKTEHDSSREGGIDTLSLKGVGKGVRYINTYIWDGKVQ